MTMLDASSTMLFSQIRFCFWIPMLFQIFFRGQIWVKYYWWKTVALLPLNSATVACIYNQLAQIILTDYWHEYSIFRVSGANNISFDIYFICYLVITTLSGADRFSFETVVNRYVLIHLIYLISIIRKLQEKIIDGENRLNINCRYYYGWNL